MAPLDYRCGQRVTAHGVRGDSLCPVPADAGAVGAGTDR